MRHTSGPDATTRKLPVQLTVAGLTALALAAGIGLPAASASPAASPGGPPSYTRAQSIAYARTLLPKIVLPPGSISLPQRPVPPGLRQPSGYMLATDSIDIYRLYKLPGSIFRSARFLDKHVPAGMIQDGTGTSGDRHGITSEDVSYVPRRLPRGVQSADLVATVVRAPHHHSYLRTDVQVVWYPARSAAEHLSAADYTSVRITAWVYGRHVRRVSRTFQSEAIRKRIIRLLDSLPASPGETVSCPLILATYRLTFFPVAGQKAAVVSRFGCTADGIQVGGVTQPALSDFGRLSTLAGHIMHIRPRL
jgi:hypothetical protein